MTEDALQSAIHRLVDHQASSDDLHLIQQACQPIHLLLLMTRP